MLLALELVWWLGPGVSTRLREAGRRPAMWRDERGERIALSTASTPDVVRSAISSVIVTSHPHLAELKPLTQAARARRVQKYRAGGFCHLPRGKPRVRDVTVSPICHRQ